MPVWGHGTGCFGDRWRRGPRATGRGRRRSEPPAQACPAGSDRSLVFGTAAGGRGGAPCRGQPADSVALAAPLCRARCGWAAARQDAAAGQAAAGAGDRGQGARAHLLGAAGRDHPLDRPGNGQGHRHQPARGAAHLGGPPPASASHPHLQALQRSRLRREGRGHCRPLHEPSGPRRRAVDRREEPDPGARPHPCRSSPASAAP